MKFRFNKHHRGVSPAIAVILLLGLTVLAGGTLYITVISNQQDQGTVSLAITEPVNYKTTETIELLLDLESRNIDTFTVQIENPLFEPLEIDLANSAVYNATTNLKLDGWHVASDADVITLQGQQTVTINFETFAEINLNELDAGDQIYLLFAAKRPSEDGLTLIQSNTYTIESGTGPAVFSVVNTNIVTQSGTDLFFFAADNQTVTTNLTFILWNVGNPDQTYEKTIEISAYNTTIFSIDDEFKMQTVTIPSATTSGTGGDPFTCGEDQACIEVNIPITKVNLTALGITREADTYAAILSITNMKFITYNFHVLGDRVISFSPEAGISFEFGGLGNPGVAIGLRGGYVFLGNSKGEVNATVTVILWNNLPLPFEGTLFLSGLNTTAFKLYGQNQSTVIVPTGVLPAEEDMGVCNVGQPCVQVNWTIARLPLRTGSGFFGKENTGVLGGYYSVFINFLEINDNVEIPLYIACAFCGPAPSGGGGGSSNELHVDSITTSTSTFLNQIFGVREDISVTIVDGDGNPIKTVSVLVQITYPDGSTELFDLGKTGSTGVASATKNFGSSPASGTYTVTVTQVSKTQFTYDASSNVETVETFTY